MRLRSISAPFLLGLVLSGILASDAQAAPIRYLTDGYVGTTLNIRFEGAEGTFGPGTAHDPGVIPLGQFVIDRPTSAEPVVFDQVPFYITLQAPDLHRESGEYGGGPSNPLIKVDNSVLIQGRLNGQVSDPMSGQGLRATIESIRLGSHHPITLGHIQKYEFPIPLENLKISSDFAVMWAPDSFDPVTNTFVSPVVLYSVPEPATAWVFVAGLVLVGLRGRRSRRGSATT